MLNPYPVRTVKGTLILNRHTVKVLVDHDAGEIRVSSLVPRHERIRLVAWAREIAAADADHPGPFAFVYTQRPEGRDRC
ncbi:MAG TPA: hypothetical protein VH475_00990 [Tepidisphaeraceae bacterium]|jgi:hypothetical protein